MSQQQTVQQRPSTTTLLSVRGLSKTYRTQSGEDTRALEDVDFEIGHGEFVSVVGPSGCGKTTLMKMCAGLVGITEGHIDYSGTGDTVPPGRSGIVFQTPALLPWRTILANVMLPAHVLGLDTRQAKERARELLALVQLGHVEDKYPGELSGGMQQRASIARALLHDPEILFMDEPFGALDAMTREELNMQLQDVHMTQRKTILFITHSIHEAVLLSDRVLVMSSGPGRLLADRTVPFDRPRHIDQGADPDFAEMEAELRALLSSTSGKADA
jgi:NitT/TauT family transport system ATP-binding protein